MAAGVLFPQSKAAAPRVAGGAVNGTRVFVGLLLALVAIAAIVGVVVAAASGQANLAIIIGIFTAAFFSRVLC